MIQNLENKIKLQINNLETRIEKMQEMFNKDLEEIKKSQLKMNNAMLLLLLCHISHVQPMRPHRPQPTTLLRSWDSQGKNTGVGCHFLLQCVK